MIYRLTYMRDNLLISRRFDTWERRSFFMRNLDFLGIKSISATMHKGYVRVNVLA